MIVHVRNEMPEKVWDHGGRQEVLQILKQRIVGGTNAVVEIIEKRESIGHIRGDVRVRISR